MFIPVGKLYPFGLTNADTLLFFRNFINIYWVLIKCADELLKCSHRFISGQDINLCTLKN